MKPGIRSINLQNIMTLPQLRNDLRIGNTNLHRFTLCILASILFSLSACDVCEVKGKVTFDNSERLWCNCEVTWQNGDVYVIDAGETRTYEFFRGTQSFDAYCGNDAFGNDLCGLEEGIRTRSYDIDCGDEHVMNLNF